MLNTGSVRSLHIRPAHSPAPRAVATALAIAGIGLEGDRHADPFSPRQLLLAGTAAYAAHGLPDHALRENLLLDIDTADLRSGSLLQIGTQAVLWLTFQCEPCGQLEHDAHQPGLGKRIGARRGMLARVMRGGEMHVGDRVMRLERSLSPWSDDWRERFAVILRRVPDGMAVDYKQLARLAGVQTTYCRVFPRMARELGLSHKALAMRSNADVPRWDGSELFATAGIG